MTDHLHIEEFLFLYLLDQKTINTRSVLGYYRAKSEKNVPSKNTLVMGLNVLNSSGGINNDPNTC